MFAIGVRCLNSIVPGPPLQLQVLVASTTQIKVGWQPPAESHGGIRAYHVYLSLYQ